MAPSQPKWLRAARALIFSRRGLIILKGSLSYSLAFVFIFLRPFDRLNEHPQTLASMFVAVAGGQAGKAVGAVVSNNLLSALGLCLGGLNFFILAKLAPWTVAQAVYFFLAVYGLAYVKAMGLRFFGFALFAILMSFNGIFTSLSLEKTFDPKFLVSYLEAYLWGTAINIAVSVLVFPVSSEKELRKALIVSLQHIETFGMLISKSYLMIINEEERQLRDNLAQAIRADFGSLQQKLEETTLEINWSRWSLDDYRYFIAKTRALQLALISAHSSMSTIEKGDGEFYRTAFVPKTLGPFNRVRLDMRMAIREIEVAFGFHTIDLPRCVWDSYMDIENRVAESERPSRGRTRSNSFLESADDAERAEELRAVAQRLAAEFENGPQNDDNVELVEDESQLGSQEALDQIRQSATQTTRQTPTQSGTTTPVAATTKVNTPHTPRSPSRKRRGDDEEMTEVEKKAVARVMKDRGPKALLSDFAVFKNVQHELIASALIGGKLTDCGDDIPLKVNSPQPSVFEMYGHDLPRGKLPAEPPIPAYSQPSSPAPTIRRRVVRVQGVDDDDDGEETSPITPRRTYVSDSDDDDRDETEAEKRPPRDVDTILAADHSLIRIYSMLFALTQYVTELHDFHKRVTAKDSRGRQPRRQLHFHFFESLKKPETPATLAANAVPVPPTSSAASAASGGNYDNTGTDLSFREAMSILEGRSCEPKQVNFWQRVHELKMWLLGPNSLYAAKTAGAATVFAIFIYAETTRSWFISYNLTGGLITVVVALAPTLGQSALTFLLQIAGSSIGYLVGLALLSIFHNVGGYIYNPYGITCLVFLYCLPLQYLIYEQPKYFTLAFLALNGAGVIISTEWIYRDVLDRNFDSPAYRAGKALAALAVAIAVVTVFQLFVARNPARRTLRKRLAQLTRSNLAYLTLLQAFVRTMIPVDPKHKVPPTVVARVHKELKRREIKIQGEIISIMPLLTFAAAEPSLSKKFSARPYLRIIKANQILLDRLRESRDAIGTATFDDEFLKGFVAPLSPYRRRSARMSKTCLALSAASLATKMPLSSDIPRHEWNTFLPDFLHDALVLSHRFAKTPGGQKAVQCGEFTRYWFYVLNITSIYPQLREIQDVCQLLFGKLEETLL
ncbi:hypothetical protein FRC01_001708 [Tulasnella sp. 417]|nr:hypothetical protein FRC01_001708 [Tulasnella sp. 417]